MKRYSILFRSMSTGGDVLASYGETPQQAVEIARSYGKDGYSGLKIQDHESGQTLELEDFARQHSVR